MSTLSWPEDLPQAFESQGFGDSLPDQRIGSAVDLDDKIRRDSRRSNEYPITGSMIMTSAEWIMLRNFYRTDLVDGIHSFSFPDIDDEEQTIVVAFANPPQFTTIGGDLHRVQIALQRQG